MTEPLSISPAYTQPAVQPTQITIHPLPEKEVAEVWSPYQSRKQTAPDIVNENFFASFSDVLDAINPLQHIPIVSTIYRELTGDTISSGARVAGGTLFGGPIGLFASIIDSIAQDAMGKDVGGNIFAMVTGRYEQTASLTEPQEKEEEEQQTASVIPPLN